MPAPSVDRRTFLIGAAGAAGVITGTAPAASAAPLSALRVYVLVVDGCLPGEINPVVTPQLAALRPSVDDAGTPPVPRYLRYHT